MSKITVADASAMSREVCEEDVSDHELLHRFVDKKDEHAFTAIVLRHGAMVLAVALRTLRDRHAAEDVFQATFLVLAKDAAKIRRQQACVSWLHGIAFRLARKALLRKQRDRPLESLMQLAREEPVLEQISESFQQQILDEELQKLPEAYREVLVLHFLEGKSYEDTAQALGITDGALRGRMQRAKKELHLRLMKRGVEMTAVLAAMLAWQSVAEAAVQPALVTSAVTGGMAIIQGASFSPSCSSEAVHLATKEASMLATSKLVITGLLAAVMLGWAGHAGVAALGSGAQSSGPSGTAGAAVPLILAQAEEPGEAEAIAVKAAPSSETGGGPNTGISFIQAESNGEPRAWQPDNSADPLERQFRELYLAYFYRYQGRRPSVDQFKEFKAKVDPQGQLHLYADDTQLEQILAKLLRLEPAQIANPNSEDVTTTLPPAAPTPWAPDQNVPTWNQIVDPLQAPPAKGRSTLFTAPTPVSPSPYRPAPSYAPNPPQPQSRRVVIRTNQSPTARSIEEALNKITSLQFEGVPFTDALRQIAKQHGINIVLDKKEIPSETLKESSVSLSLEGITLRAALKLVLQNEGSDLSYIIEDEVLKVTSSAIADETMETRVYDLAGMRDVAPEIELAIEAGTKGPWHHDQGTSSDQWLAEQRYQLVGSQLLVRANTKIHQEVETLLKLLGGELDHGDRQPRKQSQADSTTNAIPDDLPRDSTNNPDLDGAPPIVKPAADPMTTIAIRQGDRFLLAGLECCLQIAPHQKAILHTDQILKSIHMDDDFLALYQLTPQSFEVIRTKEGETQVKLVDDLGREIQLQISVENGVNTKLRVLEEFADAKPDDEYSNSPSEISLPPVQLEKLVEDFNKRSAESKPKGEPDVTVEEVATAVQRLLENYLPPIPPDLEKAVKQIADSGICPPGTKFNLRTEEYTLKSRFNVWSIDLLVPLGDQGEEYCIKIRDRSLGSVSQEPLPDANLPETNIR